MKRNLENSAIIPLPLPHQTMNTSTASFDSTPMNAGTLQLRRCEISHDHQTAQCSGCFVKVNGSVEAGTLLGFISGTVKESIIQKEEEKNW